MCRVYIWILLTLASTLATGPCPVYHFPCSSISRCISSSQVCDGIDNCGDRSDEPEGCTPCNKTYLLDVGETGRIRVPRPRGDKLPFNCWLTLSSPQSSRIEVQIEQFSLGRFQSHHVGGCPDGSMRILEQGLVSGSHQTSQTGQFCGSLRNRTRPVYLSETNEVTLNINLHQFWGDTTGINTFKMTVKFRIHSRPRMSESGSTGRLVPGTNCDYKLTNCTRQHCVVRSRNYPGLYNRNLTCSYHLYVLPSEIPIGKKALMFVEQTEFGKVWIQGQQIEKYGRIDQSLGLNEECGTYGDHVTVYDGQILPGGPVPPVLLEFCRGGRIPRIISSGPDMLIEMKSSPFSPPVVSTYSYTGFQLKVGIVFVDLPSRVSPTCSYTVDSSREERGSLTNLLHDLPANSSCTFTFQGRLDERVWIYFTSFRSRHLKSEVYRTVFCTNKLRILDGPPYLSNNQSQLGEFCGSTPPPICLHNKLNSSRVCKPGRGSFLSTGNRLTVNQEIGESTVIDKLFFNIQYEFVKTEQANFPSGKDCYAEFVSRGAGGSLRSHVDHTLSSPSSIFYYGRGGRQNLTCTYLIKGAKYERILLNLQNVSVGSRPCRTVFEAELARYRCDSDSSRAGVYISEVEAESLDQSQCYCQFMPGAEIRSASNTLLIRFVVENMGPEDDFRSFFMKGRLRFVEASCEDPTTDTRGGVLRLETYRSTGCDGSLWSEVKQQGKEILLTVPGTVLPLPYSGLPHCQSRSRLVVRTSDSLSVICPDPRLGSVHLYSSSNTTSDLGLQSILVQMTGPPAGTVYVSWLEFEPEPPASALSGAPAPELGPACDHRCPGLGCIPARLWCDGSPDCPDGWDELESTCSSLVPIKLLVGASLVAVFFFIIVSTILVVRLRACSNSMSGSHASDHSKRASNGTVETMLNHKEEVS